eukprot:353458-Amphidinium_carterae.1
MGSIGRVRCHADKRIHCSQQTLCMTHCSGRACDQEHLHKDATSHCVRKLINDVERRSGLICTIPGRGSESCACVSPPGTAHIACGICFASSSSSSHQKPNIFIEPSNILHQRGGPQGHEQGHSRCGQETKSPYTGPKRQQQGAV